MSYRKENTRIKELFDNIEKLRVKFDAIERPELEMENPDQEEETPEAETSTKPAESQTQPKQKTAEKPEIQTQTKDHQVKSPTAKGDQGQGLDPEAELAKLESEFGKVNREYTEEEIGDWEFDELEKELSK